MTLNIWALMCMVCHLLKWGRQEWGEENTLGENWQLRWSWEICNQVCESVAQRRIWSQRYTFRPFLSTLLIRNGTIELFQEPLIRSKHILQFVCWLLGVFHNKISNINFKKILRMQTSRKIWLIVMRNTEDQNQLICWN